MQRHALGGSTDAPPPPRWQHGWRAPSPLRQRQRTRPSRSRRRRHRRKAAATTSTEATVVAVTVASAGAVAAALAGAPPTATGKAPLVVHRSEHHTTYGAHEEGVNAPPPHHARARAPVSAHAPAQCTWPSLLPCPTGLSQPQTKLMSPVPPSRLPPDRCVPPRRPASSQLSRHWSGGVGLHVVDYDALLKSAAPQLHCPSRQPPPSLLPAHGKGLGSRCCGGGSRRHLHRRRSSFATAAAAAADNSTAAPRQASTQCSTRWV